MTNEIDISVVLPAHNEEELLASTVQEVQAALNERPDRFEIILVENGSSDGTLRIARNLANGSDVIRVVSLPEGNYGAALVAGFEAARGAIVVNFDVDYYDFAFFDLACTILKDQDVSVVVASKRAPGADDRRSILRRILTRGLTEILQRRFKMPVSDAHGIKALRREDLAPIVARCTMRESLFDVEMVIRAGRSGLKAVEVPALVIERRPPRSPVAKRLVEVFVGLRRLEKTLRSESP